MNRLLLLLIIVLCAQLARTQNFIENQGQFAPAEDVHYYIELETMDVAFRTGGFSYVLHKQVDGSAKNPMTGQLQKGVVSYRVDVDFDPDCEPLGLWEQEEGRGTQRYIKGAEAFVPGQFGYILYKDAFPGIDVRFISDKGLIKYDFIINRGADWQDIQPAYDGVDSIWMHRCMVMIETPLGYLVEDVPWSSLGNGQSIDVKPTLHGQVLRFDVPEYDYDEVLLIDPWTSYLGGSNIDECYGTATDGSDNIYITGYTFSGDFPTTPGALDTSYDASDYDSYISKFDPNGQLLWSTYYGGTGGDYAYKVLVDDNDYPYVVGNTTSSDLMVSGSGVFQVINKGSYDSFVLKLNPSGGFVWGTYYGGTGGDLALAADLQGDRIAIGGFTTSMDMPLDSMTAFQPTHAGATDAFVAVFDTTGGGIWATYFGGTNSEDGHTIHIDKDGNILIGGDTFSSDLPTSASPEQGFNNGVLDCYMAKFDPNGTRIFSTYFGGQSNDDIKTISTDANGDIYAAGYTSSIDFPTFGGNLFQTAMGSPKDAFMTKWTAAGDAIYSSYVGGNGDEELLASEIWEGKLYVCGFSASTDLTMVGTPYQDSLKGSADVFCYVFDTSSLDTAGYSTYYGGTSLDQSYEIDIDASGNLVIGGFSSSNDLPVTPGVAQQNNAGQSDAFVFKLDSMGGVFTNVSEPTEPDPNEIYLYPNPASNLVWISGFSSVTGKANFQIIDMFGKVVRSGPFDTGVGAINIENLAPGLYLIDLNPGFVEKTVKRLVIR